MPGRPFQFVGDGGPAPASGPSQDGGRATAVGAAQRALEPTFTLSSGRKRSVRRVWLDTFDWRLHRAGLALEQVTSPDGTELTLTGEGGQRIAVQQESGRWPAQLDQLAPGPVRDLVAPVVGVRALSPVARASSALQELRVLNDDRKTVARLTVDRMPADGPALATLVSVAPVRGYQADAEQVARALAASETFSPASGLAPDPALAAAGRRPEDYTNRVDVSLTASMPADQAMAVVLLRLLGTLEANVDGVLRDLDTEFLHDLRVSVRRTRSALKLAGDVLPAGLAGRFTPEFKWLGDLTTPTRDMDVYLLGFPAMAEGLAAASAEDLAPFGEFLARQRTAERKRLVRGLRSARFADLTSAWRAELTKIADRGEPHGRSRVSRQAQRPAAAMLATERVRKAYRKVLRRGSAITAESPPEDLHTLRKRCKELRYLLEFFASLYDPADHRKVVKQLKKLQDCLGEFQDTQVQQENIRAFAQAMTDEGSAPAATLLAMGEAAAQIAARQRRARAQFQDRFAAFTSAPNKQRMKALTGAA